MFPFFNVWCLSSVIILHMGTMVLLSLLKHHCKVLPDATSYVLVMSLSSKGLMLLVGPLFKPGYRLVMSQCSSHCAAQSSAPYSLTGLCQGLSWAGYCNSSKSANNSTEYSYVVCCSNKSLSHYPRKINWDQSVWLILPPYYHFVFITVFA